MKKVAVMTSDNEFLVKAVKDYFEEKDVEIVCISDELNSSLKEYAKSAGIKYEYIPSEQNAQYFSERTFDLIVVADYKSKLQTDVLETGTFINIHPSLLPSFKGNDAIQRAFTSGVKVSGVTVHYLTGNVNTEKIIAQYPILISTLMHFDEFENEIIKTEKMLYPIVIEKLLNDEVFDFADLVGNCAKGCGNCEGGCGGCH